MGYDEAERVTLKLEFLRMLVRRKLDPARSGLLLGFFDSYIKLSAEEERQLVSETRSKLNHNEANVVREYTNSYIEMGREEGISQGLSHGLVKGKVQLLLKLLKKRFGVLPADTEARISLLPADSLDGIGEALLDIQNIQELEQLLDHFIGQSTTDCSTP